MTITMARRHDGTMELQLVAVDPHGPDAQRLLVDLTAEITAIYADLGYDGTGGFALADLDGPRAVFVVAYADGHPVGCGALRPYADDIAEVKRMYTVPAWRGRGVAAAVLAELERHARAFGYPTMRLETGDRQPGAIRLYERAATATSRRLDRTSHGTTASVSRSRWR